jgi:hypothetical protein
MSNLTCKIAKVYSGINVRYSVSERKPITRLTLMLLGAGCEYWKKTNGGCTMCGFNQSTKKYTHGLLLPNVIFRWMYQISQKAFSSDLPQEISIFNGGSFWNNKEIPEKFQTFIMRETAKHPTIDRLMIESRCEYITEAKIREALEMLNGKKLKIAIGLESQDDFVRNKLIRKGLSKRVFENTVQMARDCGAEVSVYVFLKPLGLTEKEALKEAVESIKYAFETGATEIDLSCAFIQEGTPMAESYHKNEFQPPRLWTILEIIQEIIKNDWPVSIGGFEDEPPPIAIPSNCPQCSQEIYELIEKFRQTRILEAIPSCSCKKSWEELP